MSKTKLMNEIAMIDGQLEENRKVLEPYLGRTVVFDSRLDTLVRYTRMLMKIRVEKRDKLAREYGVFVI